ncbi:uncharacterized protein DSM5745_03050 [Aspergillus mulundensis]|uniref:RNA helicase HEL117 n=1 Tax=Aspergillus mulundensis TaxID=1810919 RepID=A0A3D8SKT0_9EURO|nr:Uncharacterized protein DSM5745_03050 [Aspergillus mulundensis]RDW86408.1 Uncharacterized protein DSM5745_03050 [Aspergillus mulundensis]
MPPPSEYHQISTSPSRARSRSPTRRSHEHCKHHRRDDYDRDREGERERRHRHGHPHSYSHSYRRDRDRDRRTEREPQPERRVAIITLPFKARELRKRDLEIYEPMFAMYLDIQKGKLLEDMAEDELKGRWKSFVGKWNRGELAEGWYDPATLEKARSAIAIAPGPEDSYKSAGGERQQGTVPSADTGESDEKEDDDDDDDEYGPMPQYGPSRGRAPGPAIPTMQDLELRKETAIEDAMADRYDARQQHRAEIRSHRSTVRHMEDEVAPRAEPGTHERRMEKRREAATSNRAFAESRRGGSPTEGAPDDELMGSGENDLAAIKSAREREQRKKNERELRREEILRAKTAEREERVRQYREKEEETIGWLKTLAKQRFG